MIAPVRRKAAASSAEESRCVASAEAIAVAPSAIGAAEGASGRRIACAEGVDQEGPRMMIDPPSMTC